jgi:phospholipid/cholesterol/gamma-HCH transport system substrate-binding protein
MTQPHAPMNSQRWPRYKRLTYEVRVQTAGLVMLLVAALIVGLVWLQFRGAFTPTTQLTVVATRAGLVMEPGSKVTFNGVPLGRVTQVTAIQRDGTTMAQLKLNVDPRYIDLIPANADVNITASTVFGAKYVSFRTPKIPVPQPISSARVIDATSVTTEVNTLFETITSISEKVDPVKLNLTLSATADALTGLGVKFGHALVNANAILDDVNPRMPQIRHDTARLADLGDVYSQASPDLWNFLKNAVTTAHSLNENQYNLDQALLAAVGFGNTAGDVFERSKPYFVRGAEDLVPTSQLSDKYSPEIACTIGAYREVVPLLSAGAGGNGYSIRSATELLGGDNPYVYPDNLPRTDASGGPGGKPGCWAPVTRDLWPAPYLVMDTGASIAPHNHFELGQPILTEYVWGRQVGENTINP